MADDPFDNLWSLEDGFYKEGYELGIRDGSRQSRISARLFGIEKGYEKFITMGYLQAKARIWTARLGPAESHETKTSVSKPPSLPVLGRNARLEKHLDTLWALVDPSTLSLENSDDAVAEFDDRLKRAQAKEKIIERLIGADPVMRSDATPSQPQDAPKKRATTNMEDFGTG